MESMVGNFQMVRQEFIYRKTLRPEHPCLKLAMERHEPMSFHIESCFAVHAQRQYLLAETKEMMPFMDNAFGVIHVT